MLNEMFKRDFIVLNFIVTIAHDEWIVNQNIKYDKVKSCRHAFQQITTLRKALFLQYVTFCWMKIAVFWSKLSMRFVPMGPIEINHL